MPVNAKHFDGTFTITGFTTQTVNGVQQLAAVGTLVGTQHRGPELSFLLLRAFIAWVYAARLRAATP